MWKKLTFHIPTEWSGPWTPHPAAPLHSCASCTSSVVCTLPRKERGSFKKARQLSKQQTYDLTLLIKQVHFILVYRLYRCRHSPTRPALPSLLCLSSGRTLYPVTVQWTAPLTHRTFNDMWPTNTKHVSMTARVVIQRSLKLEYRVRLLTLNPIPTMRHEVPTLLSCLLVMFTMLMPLCLITFS